MLEFLLLDGGCRIWLVQMLIREGEFAGGNISVSTTCTCVACLLIIGNLVRRCWLLLLSFAGAVVDLL